MNWKGNLSGVFQSLAILLVAWLLISLFWDNWERLKTSYSVGVHYVLAQYVLAILAMVFWGIGRLLEKKKRLSKIFWGLVIIFVLINVIVPVKF